MELRNLLKGNLLNLFFLLFITSALSADVIPVDKNIFIDSGKEVEIKTEFILVVLDETGVGRCYYVDSKEAGNTVIWSYRVAAGREPRYHTPSGIFKVYHKKKEWMSTKYPDESGINNMDNSLFFNGGIAMHKGNPYAYSHGCVHVGTDPSEVLFNHVKVGTPVIVTRNTYIPFLSQNEKSYIFKGTP